MLKVLAKAPLGRTNDIIVHTDYLKLSSALSNFGIVSDILDSRWTLGPGSFASGQFPAQHAEYDIVFPIDHLKLSSARIHV